MATSERELLEQLRRDQGALSERQELEMLRQQQGNAPAQDVVSTPFQVPQRDRPSRFGTGGLREATTQRLSPEMRALAERGIDVTTGAPVGRFRAGFAQNEAMGAQDMERQLSEYFGSPIIVRRGPDSGQLEYLHPVSKRFTLINEGTVTGRDVAGNAGDSLVTIGAMGGAILGAPLGLPGVAGGGAAGAALGDAARRGVGQAMGVRDETPESVARGMAGAASMEAAGAVVGEGVIRAAQGARRFMRPPAATPDQARRLLDEAQSAQEVADEISRRTGQPLQPFTGQTTGDPVLLAGQQRTLASRGFGPEARQQARQNETTLEAFFEQVTPGGPGLRQQSGRGVQAEARRQTQPRVEAARESVDQTVRELEELTSALPRAQNQQIGIALRAQAAQGRAELKALERDAWQSVERGYGLDPDTALSAYQVPITDDLRVTLNRLKAEATEAIDPSTAAGKSALLPDALTGDTVDLHQLQVFLESLRRRERLSYQNAVAADPTGRDLSRVRDAVVMQRNRYLRDADPKLLAQIEQAESITSMRANLFDKGLVGDLLRKTDGGYTITDSDVVGRVLGSGNPEAIRHLAAVFSAHPAGIPTLQRSMLAYYRNEVVRDGIPKADLHRKFMENNGDALDALFPTTDARQLRQLGEFERIATERSDRFKRFEQAVDKTFRGRLQDLAPERVAENILTNQFTVGEVRHLFRLAEAAGVDQSLRQAVGDRIRRRFISSTGGIRFDSLDKFVNDNAERLAATFGAEYVRDMRLLLRGLQTVRSSAGGLATTRNPTLLEALARTTVARPLSAPGVGLTRILAFRERAGQRLMAQAVMDPKALHAIVMQGERDLRSRQVGRLLGVLGASTLTIQDEEE